MVCMQNGILFSHAQSRVMCVGKGIELKHIMLNEISQTQKDKSHTFFVIHRNKQGEIDGWEIKDRLLRKGIRGRGRRK